MQKLFPLLAVLLLSPPAKADDLDKFLRKQDNGSAGAAPVAGTPVTSENPECAAQGIRSGGDCTAQTFCHDLESCEHFCCCACDRTAPFAVSADGKHGWWEEPAYDNKVTCERAPQSAEGMIAPDSDKLLYLAKELKGKDADHLIGLGGKRATKDVVEGLRQLNALIAGWPDKPQGEDVKVHVLNCYRRAIGNSTAPQRIDGNAEAVCGMIFKMMHVDNSPNSSAADKAQWHRNGQNKWGMTWPGPTPHASGVACDLVLTDGSGTDCFDVGTGKYSNQHCAIKDDSVASALLDEAVTKTGGWRLDFEAWHYEWGGIKSCRCQHPDCAKNFYPATGHQSQCP